MILCKTKSSFSDACWMKYLTLSDHGIFKSWWLVGRVAIYFFNRFHIIRPSHQPTLFDVIWSRSWRSNIVRWLLLRAHDTTSFGLIIIFLSFNRYLSFRLHLVWTTIIILIITNRFEMIWQWVFIIIFIKTNWFLLSWGSLWLLISWLSWSFSPDWLVNNSQVFDRHRFCIGLIQRIHF